MTSRFITRHETNEANRKIEIQVTDQQGAGGANHRYEITGFSTKTNASDFLCNGGESAPVTDIIILFQNGAIPEMGVNGVTQEVLLAVIIDRLECFQAGPFACPENQLALEHCEKALEALHSRTRAREARGVEGTHTV